MTRSELSSHSPRVVRKAFRAQANSAGLTYKAAVIASQARLAEEKFEKPAGIIRRNPGRMDGFRWNGDSFVCAEQVDDGLAPSRADIEESVDTPGERVVGEGRMVVSLLDIARPAKARRRGAAKKFVVVPTVQRVVALEDEDATSEQWESWEGASEQWEVHSESWESQSEWEVPERDYEAEEWEQLYGERFNQEPKSYSSALRG
ncbi:hypothetical protein C8J57DRAFT_1337558 [Mycena rebaudengoi]|nr:hypothetical protein C8J57DRAFT_1337558 [Mycena rebaudengoi]